MEGLTGSSITAASGSSSVDAGASSDGGRPNRSRKIKIYEQPQIDFLDSNDPKKKKKKLMKAPAVNEILTPKKAIFSPQANISSNVSVSSTDSVGVSSSSKHHSSKMYNSIDGYNSQLKRPRGRPPLSTATKKPCSAESSVSGSVPMPPITPNGSKSGQAFVDDGNGASTAPNTTNSRMPRPPYPVVVSKVLTKLMTSDPISINDLCKILSDCPRDMIQSSLDVMQIMGVAMQQKAKDGYRKEYTTGTAVYSLVHFAKAPHAVGLEKLEEDTAAKQDVADKTKKRIELLYELSEKNLSPEQRTEEFKTLLNKFMQDDPGVVDNPLYIALFESLGVSI